MPVWYGRLYSLTCSSFSTSAARLCRDCVRCNLIGSKYRIERVTLHLVCSNKVSGLIVCSFTENLLNLGLAGEPAVVAPQLVTAAKSQMIIACVLRLTLLWLILVPICLVGALLSIKPSLDGNRRSSTLILKKAGHQLGIVKVSS